MEDNDDEEIQSTGSGSDSQRSDRRISVTVASVAANQNTLMQQTRTVTGGGGRDDCWSEGATGVLIEAWGERYLELSRGNLKQKHWKEVADIVRDRQDCSKPPKTDIQCKNRIDTVKKKYKLEKAKISSGGGPSTWRFYDRLDQLIGTTASLKNGSPSLKSVPVGIPVGVRSAGVQSIRLKQQHDRQQQQQQQQQHDRQQQQRKRLPPPAYSSPESDSDGEKDVRVRLNVSSTSRHQDNKVLRSRKKNRGDSVRELTKAIIKFGEAYEQAESLKLQQMVEMQKQSMKFSKELELQRIQFFMNTQLEVSQLKHCRRNVENNNNKNHNHNHQSSNAINNNIHSDDSNN